jgi:hypothetical protein
MTRSRFVFCFVVQTLTNPMKRPRWTALQLNLIREFVSRAGRGLREDELADLQQRVGPSPNLRNKVKQVRKLLVQPPEQLLSTRPTDVNPPPTTSFPTATACEAIPTLPSDAIEASGLPPSVVATYELTVYIAKNSKLKSFCVHSLDTISDLIMNWANFINQPPEYVALVYKLHVYTSSNNSTMQMLGVDDGTVLQAATIESALPTPTPKQVRVESQDCSLSHPKTRIGRVVTQPNKYVNSSYAWW